jgi:hypothetical protein
MQHLSEIHVPHNLEPVLHNQETSLHLPSPHSQSSISVPSPSNLQANQQALDTSALLRNLEHDNVILSAFSESFAIQSPILSTDVLGHCNAMDTSPHCCGEISLSGFCSDGTSSSSNSPENEDSDSTDRHKDMAFT